MIVYTYYSGNRQVCFKTKSGLNIYVDNRMGIGVGSYMWEKFKTLKTYIKKDLKWAKLHGYVDILKQSEFVDLVDWEYYGIKK